MDCVHLSKLDLITSYSFEEDQLFQAKDLQVEPQRDLSHKAHQSRADSARSKLKAS